MTKRDFCVLREGRTDHHLSVFIRVPHPPSLRLGFGARQPAAGRECGGRERAHARVFKRRQTFQKPRASSDSVRAPLRDSEPSPASAQKCAEIRESQMSGGLTFRSSPSPRLGSEFAQSLPSLSIRSAASRGRAAEGTRPAPGCRERPPSRCLLGVAPLPAPLGHRLPSQPSQGKGTPLAELPPLPAPANFPNIPLPPPRNTRFTTV